METRGGDKYPAGLPVKSTIQSPASDCTPRQASLHSGGVGGLVTEVVLSV
jgi:hypothetical protein